MTAATATLAPAMVSPKHLPAMDDIQSSQPQQQAPSSARKRRRQILQTQRTKSEPVTKKVCVVNEPMTHCTSSAEKNTSQQLKKKPQMRYDPDIPMSKYEAAAWRRDQRRKRNRESAAASRQRQRDRITVLEGEVDEWKSKFEEAMARLQKLEDLRGNSSSASVSPTTPQTPLEHTNSKPISPCPSPTLSFVTPSQTQKDEPSRHSEGKAMHLIETIPRPA